MSSNEKLRQDNMKVRTRFAPSPTGSLHLGGVRTAFYNWLYARGREGELILRIEDTDRERSNDESTKIILDSMEWLGLDYDAGPFYQSERLDLYRTMAERLIDKGLAYRCNCSKERLDNLRKQQLVNREKPRYDGYCRDKDLSPINNQPHVVRFKNPQQGEIVFEDQVLGKLGFSNGELDDLIIIKSDGYAAYNFCVVVDDLDMKITHVIRGADHINNTPRQINIFHALDAKPPSYGHVPLILGGDGKLLSKRHGAASVLQFRDDGFLREALLNYLIRLGWSHGDQEIFSLAEMKELFDIKNINKAAASFDQEKLLWLNHHYLKTLEPEVIASRLHPYLIKFGVRDLLAPKLEEVVVALRERSDHLAEMAKKSINFYEDFDTYGEDVEKHLNRDNFNFLQISRDALGKLRDWNEESIHRVIENIAKQFDIKFGKIAQILRMATMGSTISPPLNTTLYLLGREKVGVRLTRALDWIGGLTQ